MPHMTELLTSLIDYIASPERDFRQQFLQRDFMLGVFYDTCDRFVERIELNPTNVSGALDELFLIRAMSYDIASMLPRCDVQKELEVMWQRIYKSLHGKTLKAFIAFKEETIYESYFELIRVHVRHIHGLRDGVELHPVLNMIASRALDYDEELTANEIKFLLDGIKIEDNSQVFVAAIENFVRTIMLHIYSDRRLIIKPENSVLPNIVFEHIGDDVSSEKTFAKKQTKKSLGTCNIFKTVMIASVALNQMVLPVAASKTKNKARLKKNAMEDLSQRRAKSNIQREVTKSRLADNIFSTMAMAHDSHRYSNQVRNLDNEFYEANGYLSLRRALTKAYQEVPIKVDDRYSDYFLTENTDKLGEENIDIYQSCSTTPELIECRIAAAELFYYTAVKIANAKHQSSKLFSNIDRIRLELTAANEVLRGVFDWHEFHLQEIDRKRKETLIARHDRIANVLKWMSIKELPFVGFSFSLPKKHSNAYVYVGGSLLQDITYSLIPKATMQREASDTTLSNVLNNSPSISQLYRTKPEDRYQYIQELFAESPEKASFLCWAIYQVPLVDVSMESRYENIVSWGMIVNHQNKHGVMHAYIDYLAESFEASSEAEGAITEAHYFVMAMMTGKPKYLYKFHEILGNRIKRYNKKLNKLQANKRYQVLSSSKAHLQYVEHMLEHVSTYIPTSHDYYRANNDSLNKIGSLIEETSKIKKTVKAKEQSANLSRNYSWLSYSIITIVISYLFKQVVLRVIWHAFSSYRKKPKKSLHQERERKIERMVRKICPITENLKLKVSHHQNEYYKVAITIHNQDKMINYFHGGHHEDGAHHFNKIIVDVDLFWRTFIKILPDSIAVKELKLKVYDHKACGIEFLTYDQDCPNAFAEIYEKMNCVFLKKEDSESVDVLEHKDMTVEEIEMEEQYKEDEKQTELEEFIKNNRDHRKVIKDKRKNRSYATLAYSQLLSVSDSPKIHKKNKKPDRKNNLSMSKNMQKPSKLKRYDKGKDKVKEHICEKPNYLPSISRARSAEVELFAHGSTDVSPKLFRNVSYETTESPFQNTAEPMVMSSVKRRLFPLGFHIHDHRKLQKTSLRDCLHKLESCHDDDDYITTCRMYYRLVETIVVILDHERKVRAGSDEPSRINPKHYSSLVSVRNAIIDYPEYYLIAKDGKDVLIATKNKLLDVFSAEMSAEGSSETISLNLNWLMSSEMRKLINLQCESTEPAAQIHMTNIQTYLTRFTKVTAKLNLARNKTEILRSETMAELSLNYMHNVTAGAALLFAIGESLKALNLRHQEQYRKLIRHVKKTLGRNVIGKMFRLFKHGMRDVLAHQIDDEVIEGDFSVCETFSSEALLDLVWKMQEILKDDISYEIENVIDELNEECGEVASTLAL